MKDKSIEKLIKMLRLYGAEIANIEVARNLITYYIRLRKSELQMSVEATVENIYKILRTFTYPSGPVGKIKLNYEVIEK